MTKIIPISSATKRRTVMNALVRFIVAIDNSNGVVNTLQDVKARAEQIYKSRIKSYKDLSRFYFNLQKAGA